MTCDNECCIDGDCDCNSWHIVPRNDIREHEISRSCWCNPIMRDDEHDPIWLHNSLDGRENCEDEEKLH